MVGASGRGEPPVWWQRAYATRALSEGGRAQLEPTLSGRKPGAGDDPPRRNNELRLPGNGPELATPFIPGSPAALKGKRGRASGRGQRACLHACLQASSHAALATQPPSWLAPSPSLSSPAAPAARMAARLEDFQGGVRGLRGRGRGPRGRGPRRDRLHQDVLLCAGPRGWRAVGQGEERGEWEEGGVRRGRKATRWGGGGCEEKVGFPAKRGSLKAGRDWL